MTSINNTFQTPRVWGEASVRNPGGWNTSFRPHACGERPCCRQHGRTARPFRPHACGEMTTARTVLAIATVSDPTRVGRG